MQELQLAKRTSVIIQKHESYTHITTRIWKEMPVRNYTQESKSLVGNQENNNKKKNIEKDGRRR
jgi:hypothetical protein